jgi:hypothetical protein
MGNLARTRRLPEPADHPDGAVWPRWHRQLQALGVRAQGGSPDELRQLLSDEIQRWSQVIQSAQIERQ